jgi:hypothetical protein
MPIVFKLLMLNTKLVAIATLEAYNTKLRCACLTTYAPLAAKMVKATYYTVIK